MNEKQLKELSIMRKMISAWMPNCRTHVQIHFFEELLSIIDEIKLEDLEPVDGVLAIPIRHDSIRYNIAKLYEFCKKNHKVPSQLTLEEKEMFIIEKE